MTGRILKSIVWIALIVGGFELAARHVLFPEYTAMLPDMYWKHPVLGHYNKPNLTVRRYNPMNYDVTNRTNSIGMRGLEENREKELAGVWVAGGSNTFGGYIEDNDVFPAAMRRHGIWAANLASEGHGISHQTALMRMLRKQGHRPKAVILVVTMYYAIADHSRGLRELGMPVMDDIAVSPGQRPTARDNLRLAVADFGVLLPTGFQALRARLLRSSALYGWFKVGIMGIPALRDWTLRNGFRNDLDFVQNFDLELLRPLKPGTEAFQKFQSTANYVAAVRTMVESEFGVPFGVLLLPAHHQLHPDNFKRYVDRYGLGAEDLDPLRPLSALKSELRQRGVQTLDAYPALRDSGIRRFTFPDDGHLTAPAHRVVAKLLANWITAKMRSTEPTGVKR